MSNQELDLARNYAFYTNRNIFLTGKAGTGKTTFLRELVTTSRKRIIVTAPTGVAAINAGGSTIHSFFQIGPGLYLPDGHMTTGRDAKNRFSFSKQKLSIIRSLDMLVIDEISMVRGDLLDAVGEVLRRHRRNDKPFGGVQLLLIGDLRQLAPVATDEEWTLLQQFYDSPYFFSSHELMRTDFVCIELKKVYRQEDAVFIDILNRVREGKVDSDSLRLLNSRFMPHFSPPDGGDWITLVTHNWQADRLNGMKLDALTSQPYVFDARIKGEFPELSYPNDMRLTLKVGAQVMFCKNDPSASKEYYNGKIGRILHISGNTVTVVCGEQKIEVGRVNWENIRYTTDTATGEIREDVIGLFSQIPLRLAWAITIHKSQGLTFEHAIIDAGRAFSHGQVYVALSRCRTINGLILSSPISPSVISADPCVTRFGKEAEQRIPTEDTFAVDRNSFVLETLCSLFDFTSISLRLRSYTRFVGEYLGRNNPSYVEATATASREVDEKLYSVGLRFQGQIRRLMQLTPAYEDNRVLQERINKGIVYYCKETAALLGHFLDEEPPELDNRQRHEVLQREYTIIKEDCQTKIDIFIACINGFSLATYWDAKAKAEMNPAGSSRNKSKNRKR
ncbi:MAG: AAA family ATPase [Bacteroidaceae bacterium]|nr:AAA family ATPase [Bacteroidaceae bacterium]